MRGGRRLRVGAVALIAALAVAVPATPAAAVLYPIALSSDGVNFGASYPGSLFSGVTIVPGGSITRTFWVQNRETSAGNLAVAIRSVGSSDTVFVSALTATAVAGTRSGSARLADADPCVSVLKGVTMAPSAVTRVDVTLGLSSGLTDREAQQAAAIFDVFVTLTSTEVRAPDGCTPPVPPPAGDGVGGAGYTATATVPGVRTPDASATPHPGATAPVLPETSGQAPHPGLLGNTDRFFQEYFVAWWVLAFVLGGLAAWGRAARRERIGE